ncbi:MAG: prolyl oligopeptidase family serine peptidase [Terriglobia bacterium]
MARRIPFAVVSPSRISGDFVIRLFLGVLIFLVVVLVGLAGVGAALTYYVTTANSSQEAVNPQSYLLNSYFSLNFTDRHGGEHEGWLLLGLRRAPVIILCHGYDSNRSDLLSLGTILRDNHFNVYLFNFHGPKAKERTSNLGPRQASDLMAAIETLTKQPDINPNRVGLFGMSVGGYAALVAGEVNPKVRALVVDTTYSTPERMFDSEIERLLGGSSGLFHVITDAEFRVASMGGDSYAMPANLPKLASVPKLFISGRDNPSLAAMTEALYEQAPQPKQLLVMEHSESGLAVEAEKKEYEDQILNFFLKSLSLRAD